MRLINCLLVLLLIIKNVFSLTEDMSSNVISKIKAGFEIAGRFFGFDPANSLAQMVSDTFGGKHSKSSNEDGKFHMFSGFLRLLGLDTKKISAIAVNAIIFVAQLISTTLSKPPPSQLAEARRVKDGTPYEWVLSNSNLLDILENAKRDSLPEHIIDYVKERGMDEDTDCIQLLLCKAAPLIWGMQKTVNSSYDSMPKGKAVLFANLPTLEEFTNYGDACEEKHPYCLIDY